MSDVYGAGIDQAKLFQTISLAVADTTKEVLEGEQANRIRELEAEVARLQGLVRNYKETIEGNELDIEGLLEKLRAVKEARDE